MKRDIKALTNCKDLNLVQIFLSGQAEEPIRYVTELFDRGDLKRHWATYQDEVL